LQSELAQLKLELNCFSNSQYGSYELPILLITISSFDTIGKELSCLAELDVISLFIVDEVNMIPEDGKPFRSGPGTLNPQRDSNLGVVMLGGQKGCSNLSNLEVTKGISRRRREIMVIGCFRQFHSEEGPDEGR
jgi:hypothetical protein